VYETRLKELDLKLKALQSQINPHFLYNTLESINCLAQIKNENEISEMIRDLARMFRYTGSGGTDATLEDEVTHVKDYIFLQAFRYEDKFSMEYNIPDELLKVKAVKLMLQPLVENAIHHGIEKIPGKGHIRINANLDGRSVIIEVRDNGIGIEMEKLGEINKKLDSTLTDLSILDERQSSIGIYNIHLRIKLLCGAVYGIRLGSVSGGGTSVIIRLPVA
jgi:two-component system sensor histidine kinase YesM